MIATCGLDGSNCDIRLAPVDPADAVRLLDRFRQMGWLAAEEGTALGRLRSMRART